MDKIISLDEAAQVLGKTKETLRRWDRSGQLIAQREASSNYRIYAHSQISSLFSQKDSDSTLETSPNEVEPLRPYSVLELFAGAGGLGLGLEKAGLHCAALNEMDPWACKTLRQNRKHWEVLEGDVRNFNFSAYKGRVEIVTGGFPCQAFSYAGKKLGLEDARGTLFYEFARAITEVEPLIAVGENVPGLLSHQGGKTLEGMISVLGEIGYRVMPIRVLKAVQYQVPQKRQRLIIVAIRKDIPLDFEWPKPFKHIYNLEDALFAGSLFPTDVPHSAGASYPASKSVVLDLVPPKGYWRDLPIEMQKEYMGKSYYLGGGKTGMARRIGWDEPSLTLTCSPAQKQTERCHPEETRPFTVREYARIQTFPDEWAFAGSVAQQYKQIGNAVPVNLGREIGYALVKFLNTYTLSLNPK